MYRQIRGWRHDYRNHIQTMKAYASAEDWEAIRRYLDLLDEDLTIVDTVIKTGNSMTDAILNSKISLAKAKHIQVIADAHIYDRHIEIVKELIRRPQYPAPKFRLNPEIKDFYDFTTDDIEITDYQKNPQITGIPIAV